MSRQSSQVSFELAPGSKTYFAAVGPALYAISGAMIGAHDYGHMVELLIQAAGLVALRMGVTKAQI